MTKTYNKEKFMDWVRTLQYQSNLATEFGVFIVEKQSFLARMFSLPHKGMYLWVSENCYGNIVSMVVKIWGSTREIYVYNLFEKYNNAFDFTEDDLKEIAEICKFKPQPVDLLQRFE